MTGKRQEAMTIGAEDLDNNRRIAARFSMTGRKALVTGGSVSIGREIARILTVLREKEIAAAEALEPAARGGKNA